MDREKRITEIENRLGLVLVISIFFPSFLVFLEISNSSAAQWSVLVGFYIASYFLFEVYKWKICDRILEWIDLATLWGIGVFIEPIVLYSVALNRHISLAIHAYFMGSLWALPIVSSLVLGLIIIGSIGGKIK
jgi:hypothetical protein